MSEPIKESKLETKSIKITEHDYRGLLSFLLVIGFIVLLALDKKDAASILGPLMGSAVGWYFARKKGNGS